MKFALALAMLFFASAPALAGQPVQGEISRPEFHMINSFDHGYSNFYLTVGGAGFMGLDKKFRFSSDKQTQDMLCKHFTGISGAHSIGSNTEEYFGQKPTISINAQGQMSVSTELQYLEYVECGA